MMHPKAGSISFPDEDITNAPTYTLVGKGLAHVLEGRRCFLQMTVQENLEMGAYVDSSYTRAGVADVYKRFPRLKHRKKSGRRHSVRW